MSKLTNREFFSLLSLSYINLHMMYSLFTKYSYCNLLYFNIQIYCLIDIIWILFDHVKISKAELIFHHLVTIQLLFSRVDHIYKVRVLYLEVSTLLLLLSRLNIGYLKKSLSILSKIVWVFVRVLIYPIIVISSKINTNDTVEPMTLLSLIYIHLLGLKWTSDSLKLTKYVNYTSFLLPLGVLDKSLNVYEYSLIFLLTSTNFIHHLIKSKRTLYIDQFSINNVAIYSIILNLQKTLLASTTIFVFSLLTNSDVITQIVFVISIFYHIIFIQLKLSFLAVFLFSSFFIYLKYNNSLFWHLSSSVYLHYLQKYYNQSENLNNTPIQLIK